MATKEKERKSGKEQEHGMAERGKGERERMSG